MPKSALNTLIELAQKEVDDAARQLGFAIQQSQEAQNQLELLLQYRSDYENKLTRHAKQGLTVIQYANFQSFIVKLDQAIDGQKRIISDAEYKVSIAKQHWQAQEKKRLSYQTVQKRQVRIEHQKEARRDQKLTDERATQAHYLKK